VHTIVVIHYVQNGGYCSQFAGVSPPAPEGIFHVAAKH